MNSISAWSILFYPLRARHAFAKAMAVDKRRKTKYTNHFVAFFFRVIRVFRGQKDKLRHYLLMRNLSTCARSSITIGLWMISIACSAQGSQTFDRDIRIKSMPSLPGISTFMEASGFQGKVKWYKEIGPDGIFFEGKTKLNGVPYSVEFDTLGFVKDVEKTVSFESLPSQIYADIQKHLADHFTTYCVKETQLQWTGENVALIELIQQDKSNLSHITFYEMIVKGKHDAGRKHYEFLFDENGILIKRSEIPSRNTDHLDF